MLCSQKLKETIDDAKELPFIWVISIDIGHVNNYNKFKKLFINIFIIAIIIPLYVNINNKHFF